MKLFKTNLYAIIHYNYYFDGAQNALSLPSILFSYGCCIKLSQTWWVKQLEFIISQSWRLEAQNQFH